MPSLSSFSVPQGSSWSSYLIDTGFGGGHWFEDTCKPNYTTTASYHKGTIILTANESEDEDAGLLQLPPPTSTLGGVEGGEVDLSLLFRILSGVAVLCFLYLCMFFLALVLDRLGYLDDDKRSSKGSPVVPGSADVKCTKDKFEVKMDVTQFSPEEVTVTVVDKYLVVEGKHEEKQDEHGMNMSRSLTRCYRLPEDLNAESFDERVTCTWSTDGVLLITVPRKEAIIKKGDAKVLPIKQT